MYVHFEACEFCKPDVDHILIPDSIKEIYSMLIFLLLINLRIIYMINCLLFKGKASLSAYFNNKAIKSALHKTLKVQLQQLIDLSSMNRN